MSNRRRSPRYRTPNAAAETAALAAARTRGCECTPTFRHWHSERYRHITLAHDEWCPILDPDLDKPTVLAHMPHMLLIDGVDIEEAGR